MSNINSTNQHDIVVIGAGAAGMTAAIQLAKAGLKPLILEARDRLAGRMFTVQDAVLQAPIELGSEFIHGLPPEIWQTLQAENVLPVEMQGDDWCSRNGQLSECDFFSEADELLGRLDDDRPDESFADFLAREGERFSQEAREWALGYVTGFHAADPQSVSVHSLVKSTRADEQIEGHRAFRLREGYGSLVRHFQRELERLAIPVSLNTVAERINWTQRGVNTLARQRERVVTFSTRHALITVPLGVLQSGSIQFSPELPAAKKEALTHLAMGKVTRVSLIFQQRFWDDIRPDPRKPSKTLSEMSFLFSREQWFPTWWTTVPRKLPILTGWAPFMNSERLSGQSKAFIVDKAMEALSRVLRVEKDLVSRLLREAHLHDWNVDPFSRGAYSYVCVGGDTAQQKLGAPVGDTLFFAGEATDITGHNGTVHGAIASGQRAAAEIVTHHERS
jgi:monoamine oxidase